LCFQARRCRASSRGRANTTLNPTEVHHHEEVPHHRRAACNRRRRFVRTSSCCRGLRSGWQDGRQRAGCCCVQRIGQASQAPRQEGRCRRCFGVGRDEVIRLSPNVKRPGFPGLFLWEIRRARQAATGGCKPGSASCTSKPRRSTFSVSTAAIFCVQRPSTRSKANQPNPSISGIGRCV
jgi:hypothetical protein